MRAVAETPDRVLHDCPQCDGSGLIDPRRYWTCPGCGNRGTSFTQAYNEHQPCPICGLDWGIYREIFAKREEISNKELLAEHEAALLKIDELAARNELLNAALEAVGQSVDDMRKMAAKVNAQEALRARYRGRAHSRDDGEDYS